MRHQNLDHHADAMREITLAEMRRSGHADLPTEAEQCIHLVRTAFRSSGIKLNHRNKDLLDTAGETWGDESETAHDELRSGRRRVRIQIRKRRARPIPFASRDRLRYEAVLTALEMLHILLDPESRKRSSTELKELLARVTELRQDAVGIQILELDRSRCGPAEDDESMWNFALRLSKSPSDDWRALFWEQAVGLGVTALFEGGHAIVKSQPKDLQKAVHVVKTAVSRANAAYLALLTERKRVERVRQRTAAEARSAMDQLSL